MNLVAGDLARFEPVKSLSESESLSSSADVYFSSGCGLGDGKDGG